MTLTYYSSYQELFARCVGYWDGSLNESNQYQNLIGSYHGTLTGTTRNQTDRFGITNRGYTATSGSQYITISKSAEPIGAKTILMWIKYPLIYPTAYCYLYDTCSSSWNNIGNYIRVSTTSINIVGTKGTSGQNNYVLGGSFLGDPRGSHYFIGFAWDGTINANAVKSYINGNVVASTTAISVESAARTYDIKLLGINNSSEYYFTGGLFEIMIFNYQLSEPEIKALYNLTKSKYLYPVQSGVRGVE